MGKKLSRAAEEYFNPATDATGDATDIAILMPDGEIEIGGEKITVKALRFGDQIRHGATLKALTGAMKNSLHDEGVGGLLDAFAANGEGIHGLLEAATGKPRAWIEALAGEEGEALLLVFWSVNKDFFERRLIAYPALSQAAAIRAMSAGAASSPPSSATATAPAS